MPKAFPFSYPRRPNRAVLRADLRSERQRVADINRLLRHRPERTGLPTVTLIAIGAAIGIGIGYLASIV
jgi:hypothetical protein